MRLGKRDVEDNKAGGGTETPEHHNRPPDTEDN
jgi:hypothetical protein